MRHLILSLFLFCTLGINAQDLDLFIPTVNRIKYLENLDHEAYFSSSSVRYIFDDRGVEIIGVAFLDTSKTVYIYFLFKKPIYLHGNKYKYGKQKPTDLNALSSKVKWRRVEKIRVIRISL